MRIHIHTHPHAYKCTQIKTCMHICVPTCTRTRVQSLGSIRKQMLSENVTLLTFCCVYVCLCGCGGVGVENIQRKLQRLCVSGSGADSRRPWLPHTCQFSLVTLRLCVSCVMCISVCASVFVCLCLSRTSVGCICASVTFLVCVSVSASVSSCRSFFSLSLSSSVPAAFAAAFPPAVLCLDCSLNLLRCCEGVSI